MIKPSHYDDDGYPIVWWRAMIPSNSLAALNGIAARLRRAAGARAGRRDQPRPRSTRPTRHIVPARIVRDLRRRGAKALIGLVGVQSNQYDRALDLAREFRAAGLPVMIGGFHVSGCLSMLKEMPPEIQEALDIGCSLFAGECEEGRLDEVLRDAWNGELKPIYNYLKDLPEPRRRAGAGAAGRARSSATSQSWSSFDLGRGCPFQCSFCTIINVQGRKSRFRTADDLEAIIRENVAQGIKAFFITDDNLARNRHWEEFFDRLIELREEEGIKANLTIQVDTLCHRIPNFIDKAKRAGAMRVFIGLENINPGQSPRRQQAPEQDHRISPHAAGNGTSAGVFTFAGYIIGFPGDTQGIDPPRHRDHQARAAARRARILRPDAAARLGGPQPDARGGRVDGSRPQQIQSPPPGQPPSAHVRRGMGRGLSRRLARLFHLGAYGDGRPPPRPAARPTGRRRRSNISTNSR